MRYTTALLVSLVAIHATAAPLTIERIFGAPDLSGPRLREAKFSPDGRYVTYLQGKSDNKDQLDLWAFDTRTGQSRLLVDSRALVADEKLSAEEEARRERQRTASLRGIVEYQFAEDGKRLLIPLGGDLYLYELNARANPVTRLTATASYETDARFSPGGRYVSFIRDQNLFAIDLRTRQERALTTDGAGLVQNGVAEFVAQEEMDRDTGYWWSPDDSRVAYTRIDDAPVQEVERYEINADGARMYRQRYPAAGTPNAHVELKLIELASGTVTPVDLQLGDGYLARVDWLRDSKHLAVQRQTRDQKRLDLLKVDVASGRSQTLLTETSPNWIELHNDLYFLKTQPAFVWSSQRSGYKHLYLYDLDGKLLRPLTAGEWMVVGDGVESGLVGVDEKRGNVYFLANEASSLERQLYVTSLDTRTPEAPQRVSREAGVHDAKLLPGGHGYLDLFSSPDSPPTASLHKLDGSLQHWLVRNALDETHPYHEFLANHVKEEYGSIAAADGQQLNYRLFKPAGLQPGKRYPVIVDVYGGPHAQYVRKDWMSGGRCPAGLLPRSARTARLRRVLARQSRLGIPRQRLRDRARATHGQSRDRGSAARRGVPEDARVRRSAAHRHHGLELRRLHDADGAHHDRRIQSRRRGCASHRLAALRHALHGALSRLAERKHERLRSERSPVTRRHAARQAAASARHGGRQRAVHAQHDADAGTAISIEAVRRDDVSGRQARRGASCRSRAGTSTRWWCASSSASCNRAALGSSAGRLRAGRFFRDLRSRPTAAPAHRAVAARRCSV